MPTRLTCGVPPRRLSRRRDPRPVGYSLTQTEGTCDSDTEGPLVTPVADANGFAVTLWPADRAYQNLSLGNCVISVVDACDGPLDVIEAGLILHVTSDERDQGIGDGQMSHDMQITGPMTARLRGQAGRDVGWTRIYGPLCCQRLVGTQHGGGVSCAGAAQSEHAGCGQRRHVLCRRGLPVSKGGARDRARLC